MIYQSNESLLPLILIKSDGLLNIKMKKGSKWENFERSRGSILYFSLLFFFNFLYSDLSKNTFMVSIF